MWNPINRTQVQVGENKYRIYEKNGPLFYKTIQGTFDTIFKPGCIVISHKDFIQTSEPVEK